MSGPLIGVLLALGLIGALVPWIVGAVIARRASKRQRWPEARLAFIGFISVPVIGIIALPVGPAMGWIVENTTGDGREMIVVMRWTSVLYTAANAAAISAIAVALYRFARRASQNRIDTN